MISEKKEEILEATINVFKLKGLRFTMDDIAKELSISKKTIYKVFDKKETMFLCMVDYCFDKIDNEKNKVFIDDKLSTLRSCRCGFRSRLEDERIRGKPLVLSHQLRCVRSCDIPILSLHS